MADWYFAAEGAPDGPHDVEDIRSLFQSGRLTGDTLVWSEGMQQWAPLRLQGPFQNLRAAPPPLPPQQPVVEDIPEPVAAPSLVEQGKAEPKPISRSSWAPVMDEPVASEDKKQEGWGEPIFVPAAERRDLNQNSPWSRYFARALDLTITSYLAGLGVGYALAYWAPSLYLQLVSQQAQVQSLMLLPVALVLNGIVTGIFGTTIGKSVMALRFTYLNGHLGLTGQIARELKVWIQGLAFGIPIVSIFSGVFQYRRVTKGLPASYDEGIVLVKQDDIPAWRRAIGMLFCAFVFVGGIAYSVWPEPIAYSSPSPASVMSMEWINPDTGKRVMLPAGWTASAQDNGQGAMVHVFNNADGTKQAIFGAEGEIAGVTDVATYGRALKTGVADTMTFGEFVQTLTPGVLRADGTYDSEGWRASMLVTKVGATFWRIVSIDTMATEGDVTSPALATALWSTTK
ncbi:MAG: RDD family protein [Devosia sp.]|uniref:RDD family protein n=1 Tax=Devosia sp. TaxID=1871048 RepID=UPI0019E2D7C3|nr:RDD family protein [Devosia sp.]MBF0677898.1 RDD family protein [Devosia sp.]